MADFPFRLFYFAVIVVLLVSYECTAHYVFHSLCTTKGQDVDCSFLTPNDTCTVKHYKTNSTECARVDLDVNRRKRINLGDVELRPYVWNYKNQNVYVYTLFNVTFTDIKWKSITFRFQAAESNETKSLKNHCRGMTLESGGQSTMIPSIDYDCIWSDQDRRYENETFVFEYLAVRNNDADYGKYVFIVPTVKSITPVANNETVPFIYIQFKNPSHILLNVVPVSESAASESKYSIESCFLKDHRENSEAVCETVGTASLNNLQKSVFDFEPKLSGWYFFRLIPIRSDCSGNCSVHLSAKFYADCNNIVYTVLWNVLYICLGFGALISILWIIKRLRRRFTPNVLLMYSHHDSHHQHVIKLLQNYMKTDLHWSVMWDEEIEWTRHGDPYIWCLDACMKADCILYFLKPADCKRAHCKPKSPSTGNVYVRMDEIFFKVLKSLPQKKRVDIFNVALDQCGDPEIPSEVSKVQTYRVVAKWDDLANRIMRNNWFDRLIRPVPKLKETTSGRNVVNSYT